MSWKHVLSFGFFLTVLVLLLFYWILPVGNIVNFGYSTVGENSNFSLINGTGMQFYDNMRYADEEISYHIEDCPIPKVDEITRAFEVIQNLTMLSFYEESLGKEEISITCDSATRVEGRTFIAGEGGVTNVTSSGQFSVIQNGMVLLLRESKCPDPLVGIHEVLHSLGFDHSQNPNNVMYSTVKCGQTIGDDLVNNINRLYSVPSLPDIVIENASASMQGSYLDVSVTLRNQGLIDSANAKLILYANEKQIEEFDVLPMSVGGGRAITLTNIFVLKGSIDTLELLINYGPEEINKNNNRLVLKINKK